jgi:hypothetical protein
MKNKKLALTALLLVFFCLGGALNSIAQISILFVDDTDDTFQNAETFYEAIEALDFSADYYDAVTEGAGPSLSEMENYDLVVWHTSTDGVGLYLWDGQDEDNEDLIAYLETGGNLWLVGLDFLFDRYGAPATEFTSTDFVYDFLGIWTYDSQSYGNDGELGVPFVSPLPDAPIAGLEDVTWNLETLWWVDGITPAPGSPAIYKMDGDSYPLNGETCAVLKQGSGFTTLTYLFDLALATPADLSGNISTVLEYFENLVLSTSEVDADATSLIYPNPVRTYFRIQTAPNEKVESVSILNTNGRVVAGYKGGYDKYPAFDLGPGIYTVKITTDSGVSQNRLVKL